MDTTLVDRWKNRRMMAWSALIAGLFYPLLLLVTESPQLGQVAVPFYTFATLVLSAYFGFATIDDKWQRPADDAAQQAIPTVSDVVSLPNA